MQISKREIGPVVIFDIQGEMDVYNAGELKAMLMDALDSGKVKIILNMQRVSYIDSTGIGVLLWALPAFTAKAGNLKLLCLSASILKVFQLTNLIKFFAIFDTEAEAVGSFKQG